MDRNFTIALLLSFLVVLVWTQWQQGSVLDEMPLPPSEAPTGAGTGTPAPAAELSPAQAERAATLPTREPAFPLVTDDEAEQRIQVETSLYIAEVTSRGGALTRWELMRFQDTASSDAPNVVLTTLGAEDDLALTTSFEELGLGDLRQASYEVERPERLRVIFTRERDGFRIRKSYQFEDDSYAFRLRLELQSQADRSVSPSFSVSWPSLKQENSDFADQSLVALHGDSVEREALATLGTPGFFARGPTTPPRFEGSVDWAGAESRYFLAVLLPELPRDAVAAFVPEVPGEYALTRVGYRPFPIGPGQVMVREFRGYIGPKELSQFEAAGAQLDRSLRLGWSFIAPITRLFTWLLQVFHGVIPNYGIAIILVTILVKLVTAPLTIKSMRSMQGMAKLQPKMKDIQERYKDDRPKQSEEMMKLYREAGANPISGCLPMLLQFPFFIGLYYALQSSIALRQAPFVGWIQDLSIPETLFEISGLGFPFRVLPIVMGGSMLLSQRMTPTTMDPMQARMMNTVMPVMFTVLFYRFPSGLVLYWLVNNLLQIGQQAFLNRHRGESRPGEKKTAKAKA